MPRYSSLEELQLMRQGFDTSRDLGAVSPVHLDFEDFHRMGELPLSVEFRWTTIETVDDIVVRFAAILRLSPSARRLPTNHVADFLEVFAHLLLAPSKLLLNGLPLLHEDSQEK